MRSDFHAGTTWAPRGTTRVVRTTGALRAEHGLGSQCAGGCWAAYLTCLERMRRTRIRVSGRPRWLTNSGTIGAKAGLSFDAPGAPGLGGLRPQGGTTAPSGDRGWLSRVTLAGSNSGPLTSASSTILRLYSSVNRRRVAFARRHLHLRDNQGHVHGVHGLRSLVASTPTFREVTVSLMLTERAAVRFPNEETAP